MRWRIEEERCNCDCQLSLDGTDKPIDYRIVLVLYYLSPSLSHQDPLMVDQTFVSFVVGLKTAHSYAGY